jgi:hypothetical protein
MSETEIAEERLRRDKTGADLALAKLTGELAAMDYLTNKRVEGKLGDTQWREIVERRDELRRGIKSLKALADGHC